MWFTTIVIILEEKWKVLKGAVFKDIQCSSKENSASSFSIKFEAGVCSEPKEQCFPLLSK